LLLVVGFTLMLLSFRKLLHISF